MSWCLSFGLPPTPAARRSISKALSPMLAARWCISAALLLSLPVAVCPCAHQPSRRYTPEKILTMAPTVVSGTDIFHDRKANKLLLRVECVYKAEVPLDQLPVNFDVLYVVSPSSCSGSEAPAVGTQALFALQMDLEGQNDTGRYLPFEPDILHNAILPLSEELLSKATWRCGFTPHPVVEGACAAEPEGKQTDCAKLMAVRAGCGSVYVASNSVIIGLALTLLGYI